LLGILVTAVILVGFYEGPGIFGLPDFQLHPSPVSLPMLLTSGSDIMVTVTSMNAFSGIVTVTATGPNLRTSVYGPNSPNPVALLGTSYTLTVHVSSTALGNHTLTITGTSNILTHSVKVPIIVEDISFTPSPSPIVAARGSSVNSTVTVAGLNGLYGNLTLTVHQNSFLDPTVFGNASFIPNKVVLPRDIAVTSTLEVRPMSSAGPGNISIILLQRLTRDPYKANSRGRTRP